MKYVKNSSEIVFNLGMTLFGTIVFVAYYTYLSLHGAVAQEDSITILGKRIFTLDTPVSYWWEILIFPLIAIVIIYYYGSEEYSPGGKNHTIHDKYSCRDSVRQVASISAICSILLQVAFTAIFPIIDGGIVMGPISSALTWGVIGLTIGYSLIGLFFGFAQIIETDEDRRTDDEPRGATERLVSFVLRYTHMGIVKTLPLIFGVITGYLVISTCGFMSKIFNGIRYAFKKEKLAA